MGCILEKEIHARPEKERVCRRPTGGLARRRVPRAPRTRSRCWTRARRARGLREVSRDLPEGRRCRCWTRARRALRQRRRPRRGAAAPRRRAPLRRTWSSRWLASATRRRSSSRRRVLLEPPLSRLGDVPQAAKQPALDSLTLSLAADKMTALVGPSGGGKSSALSLLLRFYQPTAGCITIGGVRLERLPNRLALPHP